ncbi:MAG TPA: hypothetical protein VNG53_02450 [Bacteroidia bacterium]|nr:hypothetical protein [Bacteroidia bacterium]
MEENINQWTEENPKDGCSQKRGFWQERKYNTDSNISLHEGNYINGEEVGMWIGLGKGDELLLKEYYI